MSNEKVLQEIRGAEVVDARVDARVEAGVEAGVEKTVGVEAVRRRGGQLTPGVINWSLAGAGAGARHGRAVGARVLEIYN